MKRTKEEVLNFLKDKRVKLGTVSGILTTKPSLIEWVDKNIPEMDLVTSKSYQITPNKGNRAPILVEPSPGSFGNAVGLKNPGMDKGYEDLTKLKERHELRTILNVSLSADSIERFITLVKKFEDIADILELNFSCPHAKEGFGASIGTDAKIVEEYMTEIRKSTDALLFPKLTPNVENIGEIALAAVKAGADGISAINTVGPELYTEKSTGKPILHNKKGHKGGKSGEWVKEIALQKIKEIRAAIGPDVPIIGMGGVSTGEDVKSMAEAGANVVGVGSVVGKVRMDSRINYFKALKKDAEGGTDSADKFISKKPMMEYTSFKINKVEQIGDNLRIVELDGIMDYEASQYAFIWDPETSSESPFSIAKKDPLTFIIRRKPYDAEKELGLVSNAVFKMSEGDNMVIRGVYGADAPESDKSKALVIVGGTGIAVIPRLVEKLKTQGKNIQVYYGIVSKEQGVFKEEIEKYAEYFPIADEGVIGRALNVVKEKLDTEDVNNLCAYIIGPPIFMQKAMEIAKDKGINQKDTFISLETKNMCGLGMCGECECGGKLTCEYGTFFDSQFLEQNKIDIMNIE